MDKNHIHRYIYTCVGNNGFYSDYFAITRSIRQGCPISALLFILVLEILAINIRSDENILGVKLNNTEFKLSLMADDMTLIIANIESLNIAVKIFKTSEGFSRLKLNLSKTEIIPIGKLRNIQTTKLNKDIETVSIKHGPFKALGIWFSNNIQEVNTLNFSDRLQNMDKIINMWKCRGLSLKGKITIIKALILPQVQFLFSMLFVPYNVQRQIDEKLFKYLWDGKPAKIKRAAIIASIENGGLGKQIFFSDGRLQTPTSNRGPPDSESSTLPTELVLLLRTSRLNFELQPKIVSI